MSQRYRLQNTCLLEHRLETDCDADSVYATPLYIQYVHYTSLVAMYTWHSICQLRLQME